jgi:hypothetical protein
MLRTAAAQGAAIAAVTAVIAGGSAYALSSNSGSTIRGCVSKSTGALFVKAKCGKGYRAISWSKLGPTGRPGPEGQPGQAATISQLTWTALPMAGTWAYDTAGYNGVAYTPPGYSKDQFGMVHLRGGITGGSSDVVATLPVGYRPAYNVYTVTYGSAGNTDEAIWIQPSGQIIVWDVGTNPGAGFTNASAFTSLDNISFSTSS